MADKFITDFSPANLSELGSSSVIHGRDPDRTAGDEDVRIPVSQFPAVKLNATTEPTANDDSGDGYSVGSKWVDVTNDKIYFCLDASVGAAVWQEVGGGGGDLLMWFPTVLNHYGGTPQWPALHNTGDRIHWNVPTITEGVIPSGFDISAAYAVGWAMNNHTISTELVYSGHDEGVTAGIDTSSFSVSITGSNKTWIRDITSLFSNVAAGDFFTMQTTYNNGYPLISGIYIKLTPQ